MGMEAIMQATAAYNQQMGQMQQAYGQTYAQMMGSGDYAAAVQLSQAYSKAVGDLYSAYAQALQQVQQAQDMSQQAQDMPQQTQQMPQQAQEATQQMPQQAQDMPEQDGEAAAEGARPKETPREENIRDDGDVRKDLDAIMAEYRESEKDAAGRVYTSGWENGRAAEARELAAEQTEKRDEAYGKLSALYDEAKDAGLKDSLRDSMEYLEMGDVPAAMQDIAGRAPSGYPGGPAVTRGEAEKLAAAAGMEMGEGKAARKEAAPAMPDGRRDIEEEGLAGNTKKPLPETERSAGTGHSEDKGEDSVSENAAPAQEEEKNAVSENAAPSQEEARDSASENAVPAQEEARGSASENAVPAQEDGKNAASENAAPVAEAHKGAEDAPLNGSGQIGAIMTGLWEKEAAASKEIKDAAFANNTKDRQGTMTVGEMRQKAAGMSKAYAGAINSLEGIRDNISDPGAKQKLDSLIKETEERAAVWAEAQCLRLSVTSGGPEKGDGENIDTEEDSGPLGKVFGAGREAQGKAANYKNGRGKAAVAEAAVEAFLEQEAAGPGECGGAPSGQMSTETALKGFGQEASKENDALAEINGTRDEGYGEIC